MSGYNYVTKWVKVLSMENVIQDYIIKFIQHEIIFRFDIPQTKTMGDGIMFIRGEVVAFAQKSGIIFLHPHTMLEIMIKYTRRIW